ncbi:hypothetical protein CP533_6293 [Ophiocordyceps camponoti-saundersi (nom. inval.)]|nr:hypothetical protein CP533_6293 [Ophiocordyceps camponoti-saundersi (nom. inval.)]
MKPNLIILSLHIITLANRCSCLLRSSEDQGVMMKQDEDPPITHVEYFPVGKGNRFARKKFPTGFGSSADFHATSILSLMEVETALKRMHKTYRDKMQLRTTGIKTHEGRSVYYAVLGSNRPRVLLVGGTRGRDRGAPDYLVYLIADLLWADRHNASLRYEGREYGAEMVRRVLGYGLALIPLANPDGVHYDLSTDSCWRKNRRPTTCMASETGVEIDAGFDVFWRDERLWFENATTRAVFRAESRDKKVLDLELGDLPEPEAQSIFNVFRDVASVSWYLDVNAVGGEVRYHSPARREVDDRQRAFSTDRYGGYHTGIGGEGRDESYHTRMGEQGRQDGSAQKEAAERMVMAMNGVGDEAFYTAAEVISHCFDANHVNALSLSFGRETVTQHCQDYFYPDARRYHQNMMQTTVGLMEFLLNAVERMAAECEEEEEEETVEC